MESLFYLPKTKDGVLMTETKKECILQICEDFGSKYPFKVPRTANEESFDRSRIHNLNRDPNQYSFYHWTGNDTIKLPYYSLSQLYVIAYNEAFQKENSLHDVRLGDVVLRVIKYGKKEPFGQHLDIDYVSYTVASVKNNEVKLKGNIHYGLQAEKVGLVKEATPHYFNPDGADFSFVMFFNLHFSTKLTDYQNVGEYLNACIYKHRD